jgi:hypothetical protein
MNGYTAEGERAISQHDKINTGGGMEVFIQIIHVGGLMVVR